MLIVKEDSPAVWVKRKVRGTEIEFKIRPRDEDIAEEITKRHTKTEWVKDKQDKKMVKASTVDDKGFLEDLVDYYLEDFKGIGSSAEKPWEVNKKNKLRLAMLPVGENEQPLLDWLLDTTVELAFSSEEEKKDLEAD